MAYRVKQFRYYNDESSYETEVQLPDNNGVLKPTKVSPKNQPAGLTGMKLKSGSVFSNYLPILQLGIQTIPGVKFYVNNSETPVIVGATGIYELDVDGLTEITNLTFDTTAINLIKSNPSTAYLIVDIIYDDREVE